MKTLALSMLLVAAAVTVPSQALAQERFNRFYVTAGLGGVIPDDIKLKDYFGIVPNGDLELDPGVRFDVGFGYQFTRFFALEVEAGAQAHEVDSAGDLFIDDASLHTFPFLVNAVFRLPLADARLVPYAGAGAGGSTVGMDADFITDGEVSVSGYDWDTAFAWQVFGGLRFQFSDRLEAGVAYRYFSVDETSLYAARFPGFSGSMRLGGFTGHAITATVRFSF
jgi:opacity protein-like surface antigen